MESNALIKKLFCFHKWKNVDKITEKIFKRFRLNKDSYISVICTKCKIGRIIRLKKLKNPEFSKYEE